MIAHFKRELSVAAAYVAILLILFFAAPSFFHKEFAQTWIASAPILVASVGMTLVILARHIDISIGSQFCICGVVAGLLSKTGLPMPLVVVCTLLAGALMGAVNGGLVAGLGLPSIVVTLATMVILSDALRWIRQGESVRDLPPNFQWFGQSQFAGECLIVGVSLVVFLVFVWAMRWLMAGRAVYAIGSDQEAARLAGIEPAGVAFGVFVLMGALTALAAVLRSVRFAQIDPTSGNGLELQVIAAVVVGGTAISGGRGTMLGTLIGVALLGTVGAALGFLSGQAQWDRAIQGAIILIAVASDGLYRRAA